jgi:hypothetical protein
MTDSHGSPPEDEPKTPMWLPALGAALFVGVALWWAVTPSAPTIVADSDSASASVAAAAPTAPTASVAARGPAPQPQGQVALPLGSARPAGSGMRLNPAIEERLRKAHEGMGAGGGKHP